jgi:rhamnosyltransferase subunit B
MSRVLFATYGSAGDLFPLIPIALELQGAGHDILFAVPRPLGLYLRSMGLAAYSIGDGSEMSVLDDRRLFSTRFDGWDSQRRVFVDYVTPTLEADVVRMDAIFASGAPDVVVSSTYAVAARTAAVRAFIPHIVCSLYPEYYGVRPSSQYAGPFLRCLESIVGPLAGDSRALLAWGADPEGIVLHDRLLFDGRVPEGAVLAGYPYWDDLPVGSVDQARVTEWLAASEKPAVVVCLGSFVGLAKINLWQRVVHSIRSAGARAIVVNARDSVVQRLFAGENDVLTVNFVPMSWVLRQSVAVVHHGGLGTSIGALHAGCPAVITPQAFDQPRVGRMVERAGAGIVADADSVDRALARVLGSSTLAEQTRSVGESLTETKAAASAAASRILDRVDEGKRAPNRSPKG